MPERRIRPSWTARYSLLNPPGAKRLAILLHGYQQEGAVVFQSLSDCFGEATAVLAPDAPFPVFFGGKNGLRLGYTWYFFDPATDRYHLDMSQALDVLDELVGALGFAEKPKLVVGYSQGGYLAPFLGERLSGVTQVVGINCRFRSESLSEPLGFRLDGIHGARDQLVDPQRAQRCHRELIERGNRGAFHLLPECGHGVNETVRQRLASIVGE